MKTLSSDTKQIIPENPGLHGNAYYEGCRAYDSKDANQTMEILRPWRSIDENTEERFPALVFIQGCRWTCPKPEKQILQLGRIAGDGFVVASIRHRSSMDGYLAPAFLEDAKSAVRYLRAHAGELKIDPERIACMGTSSGGNTALLLGTTGDDPRFKTDVYPEESDSVQAVVDCFGPCNLSMFLANWSKFAGNDEMNKELSIFMKLVGEEPERSQRLHDMDPMSYIEEGKSFPPFFLAHGTADTLVPYPVTEYLWKTLRAKGYNARYIEVPGAPHEGSFWSEEMWTEILEFLHLALNVQ